MPRRPAVHWVRWSDFVPASDQVLRDKILPAVREGARHQARLETINANDIQARITSSIQSGSGPDIIMALNNWPQLYATSLADVSDVAEEIGKAQGGYYDICKTVGTYQGKWIGVPWAIGGGLVAYRKSWLDEVGYEKFPVTWDQWHDAGKKIEGQGPPDRPDARPHFRRRARLLVPLSVVVGRQGGRGRRQDRRAEQQGNHRVGQVRGVVLERLLRSGRARLGRHQQQPRLSGRHHQRRPTTAPRSISRPRRSPTPI